MALSPRWLDELRARVTLSGVVSRTTRLTRAGHEWKACCPFHNEKSPSFTVNDAKGFYHCFGCGAHGDVIRWMTDQRGLSFLDAVKELAAEAGMELPAPDPRAARAAEKRTELIDVTAAAQDWFAQALGTAEGAAARAYLARRGLDAATARLFGFGWALADRQALGKALAKFGEGMLVETGLRIQVDGKPPYDRFRARLTLPIHDARGRVIGFGGRLLEESDGAGPKYLNSPDTPLFDKGRTLFNLHRAAPAARQAGRLVVVEGYMDAVALTAHGFAEVVAPLGTALTEEQIALLWRQVECPVLCFDGDSAGQRAAARAIGRALPLLKPGHSLSFLTLPAGQDPDDFLKARGADAFAELLQLPTPLLDALWELERDAAPLDGPEAKAGLKERLIARTEAIAHPEIRSLYRRELLERYSAFAYPPRPPRPERTARSFSNVPAALSAESADRLRRAGSGRRTELAEAVLAGLARHRGEIARHEAALAQLARDNPSLSDAVDALLDWAEGVEGSEVAPISQLAGAVSGGMAYSFLQDNVEPALARADLAEALFLLVERPALESALRAATVRFATDPEGAFSEQQRLLKRKLELEARLGQIAGRRAGSGAEPSSAAGQLAPSATVADTTDASS